MVLVKVKNGQDEGKVNLFKAVREKLSVEEQIKTATAFGLEFIIPEGYNSDGELIPVVVEKKYRVTYVEYVDVMATNEQEAETKAKELFGVEENGSHVSYSASEVIGFSDVDVDEDDNGNEEDEE
jgi:hypothetical protein